MALLCWRRRSIVQVLLEECEDDVASGKVGVEGEKVLQAFQGLLGFVRVGGECKGVLICGERLFAVAQGEVGQAEAVVTSRFFGFGGDKGLISLKSQGVVLL